MNIFIAEVLGQRGELRADESWHCAKVLRKQPGDAIHIIDGHGNFYDAVLDHVSDRQCTVRITRGPTPQDGPHYFLHLAIAPTKQIDRIEWMLEKAVEIGIHELSFIQCHNSERTSVKAERIIKIAESAVKQSLQARIPKINELVAFKDFVKHTTADQKFIAHCFDKPKKNIRSVEWKNKATVVLIGPEGDFTEEEVQLAGEKQFETLSLGETRLRTETAGLYVCNAASLLTIV